MKTYNELSQEEQEIFINAFYNCWNEGLLDENDLVGENPRPWGCPWYYAGDKELLDADIIKAAEMYFESVEREICITIIKELINRGRNNG